jgi:Holliday junction resolvase
VRRAARTDANQIQVVSALRAAGAKVQDLSSVGQGVPDLLCQYQGAFYLIEVKDGRKAPSQRRLTDDQVKWHEEWKSAFLGVVESPDEALKFIGAIK